MRPTKNRRDVADMVDYSKWDKLDSDSDSNSDSGSSNAVVAKQNQATPTSEAKRVLDQAEVLRYVLLQVCRCFV